MAKQSKRMSLEKAVDAFAGFMVLLSVALTFLVHPEFVWLTVFVGANLLQQAFSGFCPAAIALRRLGFRPEVEIARSASADDADASDNRVRRA